MFYIPFSNRVVKWTFAFGIFALAALQLSRLESLSTGPERAIDFRNIYIGSQLLQQGKNPYNDSLIKAEWSQIRRHENLNENIAPGLPSMGLLYPPATLMAALFLNGFSYTNAVILVKIFLLLQVFLFAFLVLFVLQKTGVKMGLFWICVLLFSLKPTVNMINVGQPSLFMINCLFLVYLFLNYARKKWPVWCFVFMSFLKPTIAFGGASLFLKDKKKRHGFFLVAFVSAALFFVLPDGSIPHYSLQTTGQVAAAYDRLAPEFPFTFEAMSNTQLDSIAALLRLPENAAILVKICLFLLCLFLIQKQHKNNTQDVAYWLLMGILLSLIFTYHKYYDLLQLLPFALAGIFSQIRWFNALSWLTMLHLWVPYTALCNMGTPESVVQNLQFLNAFVPMLWLLFVLLPRVQGLLRVSSAQGNDFT